VRRRTVGRILIALGALLLGLGIGTALSYLTTEYDSGERAEAAMEQLLVQMEQQEASLPEETQPAPPDSSRAAPGGKPAGHAGA
jgi:hypothetical protein